MARGYPDYNNPVYSLASKNIDFGLLAMAQMGIASVDGRGRIIWFENWREGITGWKETHSGTAVAPIGDTTLAYISPASLKLDFGTLPPGSVGSVSRFLGLLSAGKMGIDFSLALSNVDYRFNLFLRYSTLVQSLRAEIQFTSSSGDVEINNNGVWQLVGNLSALLGQNAFSPVKMTADFPTGNYGRFILGDSEIDISSYALFSAPVVVSKMLEIQMIATATGGSTGSVHIGHVIITTDEP